MALLWLVLPPYTLDAVTDPMLGAITSWQGGDALDQEMKKLVPWATDCGRVPIRGNPEAATRCALDAFAAKRSFRVRYDLQGIDSFPAIGLAGNSDGSVTLLAFDSGGHWRQPVYQWQCPAPIVLFRSSKGRLNCFPPDPEAKPDADIMSPYAESY
ncbi:MAG: hypothetical protein ACRD4T_06220 [Candidatus Acidiferrales bacterium]